MPLKIGVLMGGPSEEREVSILTGEAVMRACQENGHTVTNLSFCNNYKKHIGKLADQDIIFNALHGGIGENGKLQAWMDKNNVKYTGSGSISSALCMDKVKSKSIAKLLGVQTPKWQLLFHKDEIIKLQPPFVVKPNDQGSTVGLSIVNEVNQIPKALNQAFRFSNKVLIEEFINGRELTLPIIGDTAYPIVEIIPSKPLYDYECKYTFGMSRYICPVQIKDSIKEIINNNTKLLFTQFGCSVYSRADYILDDKGVPFFLEMNTLPGLTSTSLLPKSALKKSLGFNQLIEEIINLSL